MTYSINQTPVVRPQAQVLPGSEEQEAIFNAFKETKGHIVVKALAGTGKTWTCLQLLHRMGVTNAIYLSFSNRIVSEFKDKAPAGIAVETLNAWGNKQLRKVFTRSLLVKDKVQNIIEDLFPAPKDKDKTETRSVFCYTVGRLVSLCKQRLALPTPEVLAELSTQYGIELPTEETEVQAIYAAVPSVLTACETRTETYDFDDQMWFVIKLNLPVQKYDVVIIDEAQDLNTLQHQMVLRMLKPNGRCIVVGDDNQAIFGFRGADVDSIPNLTALLVETNEVNTLPITYTRRCPKQVVAVANQWVPTLKALPEAPEGKVSKTTERAILDTPEGVKVGDMVVCRLNAPLVAFAYALISKGIPARVWGKEIGYGLLVLCKKLQPSSINDLLVKLGEWVATECDKLQGTRNAETRMELIRDKADCLFALIEGCDTFEQLKAKIDRTFSEIDTESGERRPFVVCGSIHKAKGLEADRVLWLQPEISLKTAQDWQEVQERNLKYVAATRAKQELVLIAKK